MGALVIDPAFWHERTWPDYLTTLQPLCAGTLDSTRECRVGHTQDVADVPAGCELGAHDFQLPLACAVGVLGREG
jgi:hypothetical protein